jgi:hypothetical protein
MYCSVYEYLTQPIQPSVFSEQLRTFYHNVWDVLKPGGTFVVVVGTQFGIPLSVQEERATAFVQSLEDPWKVVLIPTRALPFLVHMNNETHALVFTKQYIGGGRKKQKSRR